MKVTEKGADSVDALHPIPQLEFQTWGGPISQGLPIRQAIFLLKGVFKVRHYIPGSF